MALERVVVNLMELRLVWHEEAAAHRAQSTSHLSAAICQRLSQEQLGLRAMVGTTAETATHWRLLERTSLRTVVPRQLASLPPPLPDRHPP